MLKTDFDRNIAKVEATYKVSVQDIDEWGISTFYSSKFSRGLQCIFTQWLVIIGLETLEDADSLDL